MSLFIRLWIIGTLIALAAGAGATGAFVFVTEQQRLAHADHEASSIGRLLSHALSIEIFDPTAESHPVSQLEDRALQFMASGRLLSITVVSPDLEPVIRQTPPGLENEEAWSELGSAPFIQTFDQPANRVYRDKDAFYVLSPLIDDLGMVRFVLAIGLPSQTLELTDDSLTLFISLAMALSLILGLIAAWLLTGQVGRPIRLLTTAADRLESGEFDTSVLTPLIDRRDEIGRLGRTVLRLVQALDHLGAEMDRRSAPEVKGGDAERPDRERQ